MTRGRRRARDVDPIDDLCRRWGQEHGAICYGYGGALPITLSSALGRVRDSGGGSRSATPGQVFPDVYRGDVLLVHRAWHAMPRTWRPTFEAHFAFENLSVKAKALELAIPVPTYWHRLGMAKAFVAGYLSQSGSDVSRSVYIQNEPESSIQGIAAASDAMQNPRRNP